MIRDMSNAWTDDEAARPSPSGMVSARISADGRVSRRGFLLSSGLAAGAATLGLQGSLVAAAPKMRRSGKAVIVLWMSGGPTQFETFDPKPDAPSGCMTSVIDTAVPSIQIAELWPNVARQMKDITLVRSMTNREGNHQRATYQLHTGYVPSGSLRHPSFGSNIAQELTPEDFDLPAFVGINGPAHGAGFLPVRYAPFLIQDADQMPSNSELTVPLARQERRNKLLGRLDRTFAEAGGLSQSRDHAGVYDQASKLVKSAELKAFDISREPDKLHERYGRTKFGNGCLLARRLVESGVTYVEVQLGGWDHHQDLMERGTPLAQQADRGFAALVADLKDRRMLDRTMVIWMGEFGRTPRINERSGRDHFPRAFSLAVAGCGFPSGTVVGQTSADGSEVKDRPVTVQNFFHTVCTKLEVDPYKEHMSPIGRPIAIVDNGEDIPELL